MPALHSPFESVVPIAALWLTAIVALLILAGRGRVSVSSEAARPRDPEGGFDYTVNLVATLPVLGVLICLVLETTLILAAKLGTVYAAYAAARSGIVWEMYGSATALPKAQQAVVLALAPFSRGLASPPAGAGTEAPDPVLAAAQSYAEAYRRATGGPLSPTFLNAQYLQAARTSSVTLATSTSMSAEPASVLTARVQYRYLFRFRIIATMLGAEVDPDTGERFWTVTTTVSRARQEVLDGAFPLGIPYRSEP
jgi:hypothetical protein